MNPPDFTPPKPQGSIHNPLAVMQPGEHIVVEIKRHPIGIFIIYGVSGLVVVLLALMTFVGGPSIVGEGNTAAMALAGAVFIITAVLALVFALISTIVYWGNSWVVTSDSITQISHTSLFHKQSAQLSLGDLEDITTEKHGILTHLFNYGVLKAETAGERSKFMFTYCPNPNYYAQKILAAREQFELGQESRRSETQPPPVRPELFQGVPQPQMSPHQHSQPPNSAYQTSAPDAPLQQPLPGPAQPTTYAPPAPPPPPHAPPVAHQPPIAEAQPTFPPVDQAANPPDQYPPAPPA